MHSVLLLQQDAEVNRFSRIPQFLLRPCYHTQDADLNGIDNPALQKSCSILMSWQRPRSRSQRPLHWILRQHQRSCFPGRKSRCQIAVAVCGHVTYLILAHTPTLFYLRQSHGWGLYERSPSDCASPYEHPPLQNRGTKIAHSSQHLYTCNCIIPLGLHRRLSTPLSATPSLPA